MTDDETFLSEFEACRWPLSEWHHRDHVKLAYLSLCRYSFDEALARIRNGIKAHNAAHDVPDSATSGYHETMTHAWLRLVEFAIQEYGPSKSADEFYADHPELSQKKTLRLFYSRDVFMSPRAKTEFLEPDLTPLPVARGPRTGHAGLRLLNEAQLEILRSSQQELRAQPRSIRKRVARLDCHIGGAARRIIAAANKAVPYTIDQERNENLREHQIRGHRILAVHQPLNADDLLLLKSIILNPDHHFSKRHGDVCRKPEFAFRVIGDKSIPILIDLRNETWSLRIDRTLPDARYTPVAGVVRELIARVCPLTGT